jgi:RNA polymerase sigma-70 factor (ECF subfamily)
MANSIGHYITLTLDELQKLARAGDGNAEKELFRQLSVRFIIITRRYIWDIKEADEAVQDALTAVIDKYKSANFTSGFSAWSYGVLKNIIFDYNARLKRQRGQFVDESKSYRKEMGYEPDPLFEKKLRDCFRKLNEKNNMYARAINLSYQGYKVAEICHRLGITANNFYSALSRARSILAECIRKGSE